jgi:hypothetical protein
LGHGPSKTKAEGVPAFGLPKGTSSTRQSNQCFGSMAMAVTGWSKTSYAKETASRVHTG